MKDVLEAFAAVVVGIMLIVLTWLYLVVTPDQMSAECDWLAEEARRMGVAK